jgi:hypothetical protein
VARKVPVLLEAVTKTCVAFSGMTWSPPSVAIQPGNISGYSARKYQIGRKPWTGCMNKAREPVFLEGF